MKNERLTEKEKMKLKYLKELNEYNRDLEIIKLKVKKLGKDKEDLILKNTLNRKIKEFNNNISKVRIKIKNI